MAKAKVELEVEGMTCPGCVRTVETKLAEVPGVAYVHVNLGAKKCTVEFDDAETQVPELISVIRQAGFVAQQT